MSRLYIAAGLLVLLFLLYQAFPYALQDEDTRMRALYLVTLLTFGFAGGARALRGRPLSRTACDGAIWIAIGVVLVFAYSFRDEFGHSRLAGELMPSSARSNADGTLVIRASEDGNFYVEGAVNGAPVRFLIDTGASGISLSPADAKRAGIDPDTLDYASYYLTANGQGRGASVMLASLEVKTISLRNIPASVNKTWMRESLLGMSFLKQIKWFRVQGNSLILQP